MALKAIRQRWEPDFELKLNAMRAVLHEILCDSRRYVPLHPFIESIQNLPSPEDLPDARLTPRRSTR